MWSKDPDILPPSCNKVHSSIQKLYQNIRDFLQQKIVCIKQYHKLIGIISSLVIYQPISISHADDSVW